jgi:hypothetical protein
MATILLHDPARRRELEELYYSWAKAQAPDAMIVMPSQGAGPRGEPMYCDVPPAFLAVLPPGFPVTTY